MGGCVTEQASNRLIVSGESGRLQSPRAAMGVAIIYIVARGLGTESAMHMPCWVIFGPCRQWG